MTVNSQYSGGRQGRAGCRAEAVRDECLTFSDVHRAQQLACAAVGVVYSRVCVYVLGYNTTNNTSTQPMCAVCNT